MKNISKIFGFILGSLIFVTPALAATTVSLLPQNVDVKVGQSFSVAVSVNPAGVKNYTIKLEMKYPADILEVESFTIAKGWTPWQQPGYYLIDNTNGILIQSAGYPGGLTSTASFGTVVFKAKKSGEAKIQVTGNSMALDATNQNLIGGLPVETSVAVAQVVTSVPATTETTVTPAKPAVEEVVSAPEQPLPEVLSASTNAPIDQTATVVAAGWSGLLSWWLWIILLILLVLGLYIYRRNRQ